MNWSNALLGDIVASGRAEEVQRLLGQAAARAQAADRSFERWNYLAAARLARDAYEKLLTAAAQLGIETPSVETAALRLAPSTAGLPHKPDPIRFPDK
jgi:hypothetical protein